MAGLESARMFKPETMIEQQHTNGAPAAELQHGVDCPKAAHIEGRCDYLHEATDDRPFDDGETMFCGRCHYWMGCPVENVIESESGRGPVQPHPWHSYMQEHGAEEYAVQNITFGTEQKERM